MILRHHFFTILAVGLCTAMTAFAIPPKAVLSGSTGGVPGDIIVLDASASEGKFLRWLVTPKLSSGRQTIMEFESGKKAVLASVPGNYTVTLIASNEEGIDVLEYVVTISGAGPLPAPNPLPVPPPQPMPPGPVVFPNEVMGMSTIAYKAGQLIPVEQKRLIPALALSFRQIGGASAAGGYNSLMEAELASTDANRTAIYEGKSPTSTEAAAVRNAFLPFFKALQPEIQSRKLGQAASPTDYGKLLIEIGVGIGSIK